LLLQTWDVGVNKLTTLEAGQPPLIAAADATAIGMAFQMVASAGGADRRFSFVGQLCHALNGVTAEAALADPNLLYDMILPEYREAFLAAEAKALAELRPFDLEVAMRRADGEIRWHRITSMPQVKADGTTVWEGLQIDVTERRRLDAELAEQRRRLELAVEATGLGFWEWDLRNHRVTWSERNRALFGLPANDAIDMDRYVALIHPDDLDRVRGAFAEVRDRPDGGDFSVEHRAVTPSGDVRWLLVHGRVETDDAGPKLVVGTSLDVTERHAIDEQRSLLMGELAHRSKNGIAVVLAIVNQTARSAGSVEQFEDLLTARLQAMAQSQDLVTEAGGRPVRLSRVAQTVLAPFGLAPFDLDPEMEQVTVTGDIGSGIALLLHEMATNAVKYGALSNGKGRIAITRVLDVGPGLAALHWRERGGPPVKPDGRRGFGSKLLEAALRNRGGKVESSFPFEGFEARVEFPRAD
jgi:PAS domain S-box-containing protein